MARRPRLSTITEGRRFPCLWFRSTSHGKATAGIRNTWFCVVNSQDGVNEMIEIIMAQAKPVLYMAREGSLLTLHVHPEPDCSFIVDLEALGASAFGETTAQMTAGQNEQDENDNRGHGCSLSLASNDEARHHDSRSRSRPLPSLRALLESNSPSMPPKVIFAARGGTSGFLPRRFGVTLGGAVEEIQQLELESRTAAQQPEQLPSGPVSACARSLRCCLE
ncbi:hypothetical protein KVR01_007488 [Diaporthe batatas]|uniref:uncharacterized protein n=1 Tax=Diaporthe batatas TaxID=748121 RepID=UPI001D058414|nr:uncharacterized protein KVR01_007488 [Diaporthe batatas]KAG8163010.1 hypothetical protein KVR01_007488 [Diaporthe batatas]